MFELERGAVTVRFDRDDESVTARIYFCGCLLASFPRLVLSVCTVDAKTPALNLGGVLFSLLQREVREASKFLAPSRVDRVLQ
jgi:hypothetical protein